jgi:meso-butanediol dehydrogenase/(S,S)-butanediol dehydrogenase/diacetyl reductase
MDAAMSGAGQPDASPAGARRVAVITGAGAGMGQACAVRLARAGYQIAALDVSADGLASTSQQVERAGSRCLPIQADVADETQADAALARVGAELGRPYALALAAAVYPPPAPVAEISTAELRRVFEVNLFGVIYCVRAALRLMSGGPAGGRIVLWSSTGAHVSKGGMAAYCASKAAIESLGRTLAVEVGGYGITVNVVVPGTIDTPMIAGTDLQRYRDHLPARHVAGADEVAALVEYLCGPDARYLTGSGIVIDGGFLAMHRFQSAQ